MHACVYVCVYVCVCMCVCECVFCIGAYVMCYSLWYVRETIGSFLTVHIRFCFLLSVCFELVCVCVCEQCITRCIAILHLYSF